MKKISAYDISVSILEECRETSKNDSNNKYSVGGIIQIPTTTLKLPHSVQNFSKKNVIHRKPFLKNCYFATFEIKTLIISNCACPFHHFLAHCVLQNEQRDAVFYGDPFVYFWVVSLELHAQTVLLNFSRAKYRE